MNLVGLGLRALLVLAVLVAAIVLGETLRDVRSGARWPAAADGRATLAPASPRPSPSAGTGNCVQLAALPLATPPPLTIARRGAGSQRIVSAEGGYTITLPSSWIVSGSIFGSGPAAFGQVHATSYDPKTAPTPDPERWMLPPSVGVSLDVQVWLNPAREPLERYAARVSIGPDQVAVRPGTRERIDGRDAYAFPIDDTHRFMRRDGTLVITTQTRLVWLIQSGRDDRVIVAYLTPGESDLAGVASRAIRETTITAPFATSRPVVHQREEVLRRWLYDETGRAIPGRRAEAKLLTYVEASDALHGLRPSEPGGPIALGLPRIDHDPEDLYWVVAVSGPDLPRGRGGPMTSRTPAPTTWILYETSATAEPPGSTGSTYAVRGTWPDGFDALPDRCR